MIIKLLVEVPDGDFCGELAIPFTPDCRCFDADNNYCVLFDENIYTVTGYDKIVRYRKCQACLDAGERSYTE